MSIDSRLNKVMPALSARERGVLVLQSLKDGTAENPSWRSTMPVSQATEFNKLIGLMNVANIQLALFIGMLERMTDEVETREAWLICAFLWQEHVEEIEQAVRLAVREPITETEYQSEVEKNRARWVPVAELAELVAGDFEGWTEADLEEVEGYDQPVITDQAWERVCREKEKELRKLVTSGNVPTRGRGRGLKIQEGAFDDLFGRTTGAVPDEMLAYRIMPDDKAEEVAQERRRLKVLRGAFDWRGLDASDEEEPEMPSKLDRLREGLKETMALHLQSVWLQARLAEIVMDEIGARFDGIDALKPTSREALNESKERLLQVKRHLVVLKMDVELAEPEEEDLEILRDLVRRFEPSF